MLHRFLPVIRIGSRVSMDIFYRFHALGENQFFVVPYVIGDDDIRGKGKARIQKSPASPTISSVRSEFADNIPYFFYWIPGSAAAGVIIEDTNPCINEFLIPDITRILNKHRRIKAGLIQQSD